MDAPLALYRRYRPETFAEVIGQEHVTAPLRAALRNNRVHHAYLFSGPRGCGKTTSARILARALNCEQGPIDEPCGTCRSCNDLARGGPGSVDVIEIDAASHGGVDDARDLRERAFFAPVASRYKVYIIDEAHMVSTQGFNALLKLVEEPPPHLKFIFATTEPEKVIGTIRSRTHHYPFRLIPPRTLSAYLGELCEKEGVVIETAALPLVVRAGAGSARDTLSVLDQLMGGAGDEGVTYALTTALLGYTPDSLLDEVVDAFAASDGQTVFAMVDKVIETGQDPRRFAEDLLRRLRDLVIIAAVPDAPATGLLDVADDQAERLVAQAARFGRADLSRAAELVADGLTELRGATAPRLLLELLCARVLLPGADHTTEGVLARLDRVEKRMAIATEPSAGPGPAGAEGGAGRRSEVPADGGPRPPRPRPATSSSLAGAAGTGSGGGSAVVEPSGVARPSGSDQPHESDQERAQESAESPAAVQAPGLARSAAGAEQPGSPEPSDRAELTEGEGTGREARTSDPAQAPLSTGTATTGLSLVDVRRLWPDVIEATKRRRRLAWILLSQNAQVLAVDSGRLTVGFSSPGARESFLGGGNDEILRQVMIDVIGQDFAVEAIVDPSAGPDRESARVGSGAARPPSERPGASASSTSSGERPTGATGATGATQDRAAPSQGPAGAGGPGLDAVSGADAGAGDGPEAPGSGGAKDPATPAPTAAGAARARRAIRQTQAGGSPAEPTEASPSAARSDAEARRDDPDADDQGLGGADLLRERLGASIIEEITHE